MSDQRIIDNLKYLELLSKQFPTIHDASTEIINLEAILNLPKGTEHFLSDVHGEDEAFTHIINSGSGIIRSKIDDVFGSTITNSEKRKLSILIYYPKRALEHRSKTKNKTDDEWKDWYEVTLHRLVLVLREVSSKYTRSKVRKALPKEFEYIIEELLHHRENSQDKNDYYTQIIQTIIQIGRAKSFIVAISEVIQRLAVDHLHIIGDIFDRGPNPDMIMDKLIKHHSVDVQWGNHDIVWMGAAAGSRICILNVIRICARYGELDILEENYGINLLPLAKYSMTYFDEVENQFYPKAKDDLLNEEVKLSAQIGKAVSLMQFKLECEIVARNPEYAMDDRCLMSKVQVKDRTIVIDGITYPLLLETMPKVDLKQPTAITEEEHQIINKLQSSFMHNSRLAEHVAFLLERGSIYKCYNGNLLYHGCIPMEPDGQYTPVLIDGSHYTGKELLDVYEKKLRLAYSEKDQVVNENDSITDIFWYLWTGKDSSLFGKDAMRTFERTLIDEPSLHEEKKNPYYELIGKEEVCQKILEDFGLDPNHGRIINGHVPVKVKKGESPIKSGGRLIVIDGGLSKAYQTVTGIAGYTLLFNSHGMLLAAHEPFTSAKDAYENNIEMLSELMIVEAAPKRLLVGDTDIGQKLSRDIDDLKLLLEAYNKGYIKTLLY